MTNHDSISAAVRGHLVCLRDDPFVVDAGTAAWHEVDGLLLIRGNGTLAAAGPWDALRGRVPADVRVAHYPKSLIVPGFIDCHIHYTQTGMAGAFGFELLEWLQHYTFPAEQKFVDRGYADRVAALFCDELLRNGTTSALVFAATYKESADALFEQADKRGMRIIAGKVMMDRNAPVALLDTADQAYADSEDLIQRWHGHHRLGYAITPRFAITSTPAQLEAARDLWKAHPDVWMHTHLAENVNEVKSVHELFPERAGYLDVYDHYALTGRRAVFAHCVHLDETDFQRCHDTGSAMAHCPTSNLFLGSGLFQLHEAVDPKRPVRVGLGTDIGGGTSFSLLSTAGAAYKIARMRGRPLTAWQGLYLATLGAARALDIDRFVGTFKPDMEADFAVLDPAATPLLAFRSGEARSLEEQLAVLMALGDDRVVQSTWVAGRPAYRRDATYR